MKTRIVDSDILINVLREHPPAVQWLNEQIEPPFVTGITVMELLSGCASRVEVRAVDALMKRFALVWPTEADLQRALDGFASRNLSHNLGILDSMIGECVLGRGWILCTFNYKHFKAIPGLTIEQPYVR